MIQTPNDTKTVLLVEDNEDNRFIYATALRYVGYEVLEAMSGKQGIEQARKRLPDLILMDLDLPILDGIAATQQIRQQEHMESVPIVAVTAYPLSYSRVKAFAKGCNEYMPKPIDMSELARVVNRYLSSPT